MSGGPKVRSINVADSESRIVLVPGSNKAKLQEPARKLAANVVRKMEGKESMTLEVRKDLNTGDEESPVLQSSSNAVAVLRRHEMLLRSNLSMTASCSSDTSTDSFCSRASTGRIGRTSFVNKRKQSYPKVGKGMPKLEKSVSDSAMMPMMSLPETMLEKRRCAWVTANTEPCYIAFHDEEWGVPAHDDKKLFELLVLSGALAELTWPVILSKRHIFRELFLDFDPLAVSKLNEKKIVLLANTASLLLSEPKLRAVVENARQIVKIIDEYGSFDRYCWGFVNNRPLLSRFRYPRQVPVKTAKADLISKDLVRRGFRSVSPTVIYSFMQAAGLTNDHLISCFRFEDCIVAASSNSNHNSERTTVEDLDPIINCDLARAGDELRIV